MCSAFVLAHVGSWIKERGVFMGSALVLAHGLKNEVYSRVAACFASWIKERGILMCSAFVLAHGLKNEVY